MFPAARPKRRETFHCKGDSARKKVRRVLSFFYKVFTLSTYQSAAPYGIQSQHRAGVESTRLVEPVSTIKLRGANAARGVQLLGVYRKQASEALMLATSSISISKENGV